MDKERDCRSEVVSVGKDSDLDFIAKWLHVGGYRAIAGHFLPYKLSMMQFKMQGLLLQQWTRADLIANISTSGSSLQGQGTVDFANENCVEY